MINVAVGKTVSISFSNGQLIGGIVEKWSEENIILRMPKGGGITIITQPSRDIVFIHILEDKKEKISQVQQDWDKLVESPPTEDKPQQLADLKILMDKTEREIISDKLKEHTLGEVKTVQYGIPKFFKKPGS